MLIFVRADYVNALGNLDSYQGRASLHVYDQDVSIGVGDYLFDSDNDALFVAIGAPVVCASDSLMLHVPVIHQTSLDAQMFNFLMAVLFAKKDLDIDISHRAADLFLRLALAEHSGYSEGIDLFLRLGKWYS